MVIFLYTDKNCEYQAVNCIKSFENKITNDIKIVYYTIGFDSSFNCKNLYKIKIEQKNYPLFHFYKAELSLLTLRLFPNEKYFAFTDTDILFSKRFRFDILINELEYPLAPLGPHEYPFMWEDFGNGRIIYDETKLMQYLNVPNRTQTYVWSCFYTFNHKCLDFLEEWTSLCKNEYLLSKKEIYYPFRDETPFNVCLWKKNAANNLGFCFLNSHIFETIQICENSHLNDYYGGNLDELGKSWEYIKDSNNIVFYHGIKEKEKMEVILSFLLNNKSI